MDKSRLEKLISSWVDCEITADEKSELSAALRDDPQARQFYLQCMNIHAELCDLESAQNYFESIKTSNAAHGFSFLNQFSAFQNWVSFVILAGLFLAIGMLCWATLWKNNSVAANVAEVRILTAIEPVSDDCQWYVEQSQRAEANSYVAGDVIRVTRGKLELEYPHGTKVVLHSPAAYQLLSKMKAKILLGRLTATVTDAAKGFSVSAPRATVVDLGTQFGIEVNNDGATDVVVFKGEVDVAYYDQSDKSSPQRLHMGEAVHLNAEGNASRLVSINGRSYSNEGALLRPGVITEVHDSIRRDDPMMKYYEIVHQGLQEDALAFVDRIAHQWNGLDAGGMPHCLLGADYVKMFNSDKYNRNIEIEVHLASPCNLYVLFDNRVPVPSWLRDEFEDTGDDIGIDNGPFFSNGEWHRQGPSGVGPGESVEDSFSVWVKEIPKPCVYVLGSTEIDLGSTLANMYGIAAVPMEEPLPDSSQ